MFNKRDFFLDEAVDEDRGHGEFIGEEPEDIPTAEDMDFINDGPIEYFHDKSKKPGTKR